MKQPTQQHPRRKSESGQAIVLMALMMVGLLAATGLAIDGGGLFFLWRDVRNATDAVMLASAYSRCASKNLEGVNETQLIANVKNAGMEAARANGYSDTNSDVNGDGSLPDVVITYPLTDPDQLAKLPSTANPKNYVGVSIKAEKPKYFIQIVYPGPLVVSTYAVGFCRPRVDASKVGGIVSVGDCNNTFSWNGARSRLYTDITSNGDVTITGSVTYVYGDLKYGADAAAGDAYRSTSAEYPYVNQNGDPLDRPDALERFPEPPDTPQKGTVSRQTIEVEDPLDIDLAAFYGPSSEIGQILTSAGVYYSYTGDLTIRQNKINGGPAQPYIQGFFFATGDIQVEQSTIGPKGISLVAIGEVDFQQNDGMQTSINGRDLITFFTHDALVGTGGYGLLLASGHDSPCGNNSGGVAFVGQTDTRGFMYAPNGAINARFPTGTFWGATIGESLQLSGSDMEYRYDPAVLPSFPGFVGGSE